MKSIKNMKMVIKTEKAMERIYNKVFTPVWKDGQRVISDMLQSQGTSVTEQAKGQAMVKVSTDILNLMHK